MCRGHRAVAARPEDIIDEVWCIIETTPRRLAPPAQEAATQLNCSSNSRRACSEGQSRIILFRLFPRKHRQAAIMSTQRVGLMAIRRGKSLPRR